jgi:hypothetical protein
MSLINKLPGRLSNLGFYYKQELYLSPAYQALTKAARDLLNCLICELRWSPMKKGREKVNEMHNNGQVSFTETQYIEYFGRCSSTYLKSRNQLIEVGFIKQTYRGGNCRGDRATYKILCTHDVKSDNQRWRRYPDENWVHEIPKAKKQLVGKETRWKKGQSGKKTNSTLLNHTLKSTNPPNKAYPKKRKAPDKVHS